ncbi:lytic transglycosylase domain-containing protein [Solirubrobacter ginsenosidimutans]|uniref:Lytic transglycosylase domain-containing protein n=1 Tax=Solirubrobacter ginsenosidimutans TaxID=490573 RepID=A0A9X3N2T9_9ACTN|nr:lytic transglycosylase domain-containing protein [Solirubrobacter ginsenosidimutans]MDA0165652.1 lytic transglycosylase domain-containing protein [Solirubrobacter ginsenosidimutans]
MALPLAIAVEVVRRRRRLGPKVLAALSALGVILFVFLMGIIGAVFGLQPLQTGGSGPSSLARGDIPSLYLELYEAAGERYGIDPWILAAIGSIETDHGRSTAPGVSSGVNTYGCCAGPMQFSVIGSPSTWDSYGVDGNGDGTKSPYDPADAIPAAARYLVAGGAPDDYRKAIFAYNHAVWYVNEVLAKADQYRSATPLPGGGGTDDVPPPSVTVPEILDDRGITLTPIQRGDVRSGTLDPRVLAIMADMGKRHAIVVTALKSDHSTYTVDGNVSNHSAGRAMDIGAVDGEVCRGIRTGRCANLVHELAAMTGPLRSTELIYCWDPDGPDDPRGFARADHCDHIHVGWDG